MEKKRFAKNDAGFICAACGYRVEPMGTSSRNHCPRCLCSLHVDDNPGDRQNACHGIMRPVRVEPDAKRGYIIVHQCEKCGAVKRCRAALDAKVQNDDIRELIRLTSCVPPEPYRK